MKAFSIQELLSKDLPDIPPDFFEEEYSTSRVAMAIPVGTIVCIRKHYHTRDYYNPECVWGFVDDEGPSVEWPNGVRNSYYGGELCTLEEFMSEHCNTLPFSWRN